VFKDVKSLTFINTKMMKIINVQIAIFLAILVMEELKKIVLNVTLEDFYMKDSA